MSSLGKRLVKAAKEARAYARGEEIGAVEHNADDLVAWRKRLNLSQPAAALRLSLPVGTFRNYEQNRREIPEPVMALAHYVEAYGWPLKAVAKPRVRKTSKA